MQRQLRRSPREHLAFLDLALVGGQQQQARPEQTPGVAHRRDGADGQEEAAVAEALAVGLEDTVEGRVAVVGQRDRPRLVAQLEARQEPGVPALQVLRLARVQAERGLEELLPLDPEEVLRQRVEEVARHREGGVRRFARAQGLAADPQDELAATLRVEGREIDDARARPARRAPAGSARRRRWPRPGPSSRSARAAARAPAPPPSARRATPRRETRSGRARRRAPRSRSAARGRAGRAARRGSRAGSRARRERRPRPRTSCR